MPTFAERIGNGDEFAGDRRDDDLVRLASGASALCEHSQDGGVMDCDQRGLEHDVPQCSASATDGPPPA